jgi:hypothetical protein
LSGDVLLDLADASGGKLDLTLRVADLPTNSVLVVDMRRAQTSRAISASSPLLHQARIAGRDCFRHGKLVRLTLAEVLEPTNAGVARERRRDEAGLALVVLPHRGVEGAERRIGEDVDLVVLVACRTMRPSRCSICAGSQGTSR